MGNLEIAQKMMNLIKTGEKLTVPFSHLKPQENYLWSQTQTSSNNNQEKFHHITYLESNVLLYVISELVNADYISTNSEDYQLWRQEPFAVRTILGQVSFLIWAAIRGASVEEPLSFNKKEIKLPYFEGTTLDSLLTAGDDTEAVMLAFNDILKAHKKGVIYGRRSPGNILINPDTKQIRHLSYEVQLSGNLATELEVAQFMSSILAVAYSQPMVLHQLAEVMKHGEFTNQNHYWEEFNFEAAKQFTHKLVENKLTHNSHDLKYIHTLIDSLYSLRGV